MERKIGEIFECNGELYQAINNADGIMCSGCAFVNENNECEANNKVVGSCGCKNDNKLIFKKLEKVGDPYPLCDHIVQKYAGVKFPVALTEKRFINCNEINNTIDIEVKENKEDMETNGKTISIPDGWEFDRIDDSGNIVLKEKKKELPKTWLKCLKCVNETEYIDEDSEIKTDNVAELEAQAYAFDDLERNHLPLGLGKPMLALCQLLVCRNAWWKQLGWKPDWKNNHPSKYCIKTIRNEIEKYTSGMWNCILAFPTEDIRNQFLETFKDLIKEAKELL